MVTWCACGLIMSSFSFNLSDIAAGTKQISDDGSLVWSDQVIPY